MAAAGATADLDPTLAGHGQAAVKRAGRTRLWRASGEVAESELWRLSNIPGWMLRRRTTRFGERANRDGSGVFRVARSESPDAACVGAPSPQRGGPGPVSGDRVAGTVFAGSGGRQVAEQHSQTRAILPNEG